MKIYKWFDDIQMLGDCLKLGFRLVVDKKQIEK